MSDVRPAGVVGERAVGDSVPVVHERFTGNLAIPRYELDEWERDCGVLAGITGRGSGFDLNMWSRDSVGSVMTRWRAFRQTVRRAFPGVVISHQCHGADVRPVESLSPGLVITDGLDGHTTGLRGVLLTVTVADCVPVYLFHPAGVVGLLHAGWRGTVDGVLEAGIEAVCRLARGEASDILMHCGVSICGQCYEVGPEVVEAVTGRRAAGPERLDLRGVLAQRATALDVRNITSSGWCTAHDADRFYSHRRSAGASGRMVAYLGRPLS